MTPTQQVVLSDGLVRGGNVLSMLTAMGPFRSRGEQILAEAGLHGVVEEGWYPLDVYVGVLDVISRNIGPNTLFQIGRHVPAHVPLHPEAETLEAVLGEVGVAFTATHRGWGASAMSYTINDERSATVEWETPYPPDYDRGMLQGYVEKYLHRRAYVVRDPMLACDKQENPVCTYLVTLPL